MRAMPRPDPWIHGLARTRALPTRFQASEDFGFVVQRTAEATRAPLEQRCSSANGYASELRPAVQFALAVVVGMCIVRAPNQTGL